MRNILTITWYSLREALARKVFIAFIIISVLTVGLVALILNVADIVKVVSSGYQGNYFQAFTTVEMMFISPVTLIGILMSIFSSASFIPVMLEKGNIDLLLSKPISREQLIIGKYLGGVLVVLINIGVLIVGVWLAFSLKFSIWNLNFLFIILTITFTFAILYSVIILFGILTKSSAPGMMIAYLIFLIVSPMLYSFEYKLSGFVTNNLLKGSIDSLYYFFPKTSEIMGKITMSLALGNGIDNYQPLLTSLGFLILTLGISIAIFRKKEF